MTTDETYSHDPDSSQAPHAYARPVEHDPPRGRPHHAHEAQDEALVDFDQIRVKITQIIDVGQPDQAAQFLEQLARWPDTTRRLEDNVWLHRLLGELWRDQGRAQDALDAYERAYTLDPGQRQVLMPYADLLFEQGQHERGLRVLQSLLLHDKHTLSPAQLITLYHRLGSAYESLELLPKARSAYEKALEYQPDDLQGLGGLLRVVTASGLPHDIIKVRQRIIRSLTEPKARSMAFIALGDDWAARLQDAPRALDAYESALAEAMDNKLALERIAALAEQLGDWRRVSRAFFTLSRLAKAHPEEADWLIRASVITREQLREPEKALLGFKRALELDPGRQDAFEAVQSALTAQEDWPELKQAYIQLISALMKADPVEPVKLAMLCIELGELCHVKLEQHDEAVRAYAQASELVPGQAPLHHKVVELAERQAEFVDLALEHLRILQRLEPHNDALLDRVARVYLRKKDVDNAYCIFRVLAYQGKPLDDKARAFVERFQRPIYTAPKHPLSPDILKRYIFTDKLDRRISGAFAVLKVGLDEWAGEDKAKYGLRRKDKIELDKPLAFNTIYKSVGRLLMYESLPELWYKQSQQGLINGALVPEGLLAGDDLLGSGQEKLIAFIVGKQLFMFLAPFYLAAIRPAQELEFFFKLGYAYAQNRQVQGQAAELMKVLAKKIRGQELAQLQKAYKEIEAAGAQSDIAAWLEEVEDSANRVGFIFCDDLKVCEDYLRHEPQPISQRPVKARMQALVDFALSEKYIEARDLLGLRIT